MLHSDSNNLINFESVLVHEEAFSMKLNKLLTEKLNRIGPTIEPWGTTETLCNKLFCHMS